MFLTFSLQGWILVVLVFVNEEDQHEGPALDVATESLSTTKSVSILPLAVSH